MTRPLNINLKVVSDEELENLCKKSKLEFLLEISGILNEGQLKNLSKFLSESAIKEFNGIIWLMMNSLELRTFQAIGKPIKDELKRCMTICFNNDVKIMEENFMIVLNYLRSLVGIK